MSARAWERRRRNKYLRQSINRVRRNPNLVIPLGPTTFLYGLDVARRSGLIKENQ